MTDEKMPAESRNRMSRRTVLKLTGAGAAIAWTTPIISSVRMPAFAASVNCGTVVFSDDFEAVPCGLTVTSLPGWSFNANNVDVVGDDCIAANGGSFGISATGKVLDLDGTGPCGGVDLQTTNPFSGPGPFQVEFALGGSQRSGPPNVPPNTVSVFFGATLVTAPITLNDSDPISPYTFVVAGPGPLRFLESGGDCVGLLLDNVKVSSCP